MTRIKKIIRICTITHWCRKTIKSFTGAFKYYFILYCSDDGIISVGFKYIDIMVMIDDTSSIKTLQQFTEILVEKCRRLLYEESKPTK